MFICIDCDKKNRDFLGAIALVMCDCCKRTRMCIYVKGGR
jgi:hypothetical protein